MAGVKSRVMSDEMMRGIRHCLEWLQFAIRHIEQQVMNLRDYIAKKGRLLTCKCGVLMC